MSFSYSGNPNHSATDELRFLIGDTQAAGHIVENEELEYLISTYSSSRTLLLSKLYRHCANVFNRKPNNRKLGPQSEDTSERQAYFAKLAEKYEKQQSYTGVPPTPEYSSEKVFDKDMMSNDG